MNEHINVGELRKNIVARCETALGVKVDRDEIIKAMNRVKENFCPNCEANMRETNQE